VTIENSFEQNIDEGAWIQYLWRLYSEAADKMNHSLPSFARQLHVSTSHWKQKLARRRTNRDATFLFLSRVSASRRFKSDQLPRCSTKASTKGTRILAKNPSNHLLAAKRRKSTSSTKPQTTTKSTAILPEWIVHHPSVVRAVPIVGNLAYLTLASGFLCKDVLDLRLLLVGGYGGLVVYHSLRPVPLRIPLKWSLFFVVVNASMAAALVWDNLPPSLTPEEEDLHVNHFAPLGRKDFRKLMDLATMQSYNDGDLITIANEPCDKLFFILEGTANMKSLEGKHISKLQKGAFPNCMAFQRSGWNEIGNDDDATTNQQKRHSYGTVTCQGPVTCLVWESQELLPWLAKDENLKLRMDHAIIEAVIRRLLVDSEGANVKDYIRVISQGWAHNSIQQRKIQTMLTNKNRNKSSGSNENKT